MDSNKHRKKTKTNVWLAIGVAFLIILLILWLTMADLWGDTDVAQIAPMAANLKSLIL